MYYKLLPVKMVINKRFYERFKREIDWQNPKDINEKINWLKLNSDTKLWGRLADKFLVREYVASKGLKEILVDTYGKWDAVDDIDFNSLPNSFVLKTNHGWGDVIVVKDKNKADIAAVRRTLKKNLAHKHGYTTGEPHYLSIKPCIIAESLLIQNDISFTESLVDYKIWCFHGRPYFVWACYNRTKNSVYVESRDLNWNYMPEKSVFIDGYLDGRGILPKPNNLDKMLEIATTLSSDIPLVRVDLYSIGSKVYFGEMTMTPDAGYNNFFTAEFLMELGNQLDLNKLGKWQIH